MQEKLLGDEGLEIRNRQMSWVRIQYRDDTGYTDPVTTDEEEDEEGKLLRRSCWGLKGYVEALEAVVEFWTPDTGKDHHMRYWIETRIVPP